MLGAFSWSLRLAPVASRGHVCPGDPDACSRPAPYLLPLRPRELRTVIIVSNNSGAAIAAYLADHRLSPLHPGNCGCDDHGPERMKPSPFRIREAVGILDADSAEGAFIGDTTSDVIATS